MTEQVWTQLACPVCGAALAPDTQPPRSLRCPRRHAYDLARQGHVSLLAGGHRHAGDTPEMVAHRLAFLGAAHYVPIADALVAAAAEVHAPGLVLDIAGGPGWYAARLLDAFPGRTGVTFDTSTAAARRAAKAHPRLVSVVADGWERYPVVDGSVAVALCIFAPRHAAETLRVLHPEGRLLVVTPQEDHLAELRERFGLLSVAADKDADLVQRLHPLTRVNRSEIRRRLDLSPADAAHLSLMGPSAFHLSAEEIAARAADLAPRTAVTCAVSVSVFAQG